MTVSQGKYNSGCTQNQYQDCLAVFLHFFIFIGMLAKPEGTSHPFNPGEKFSNEQDDERSF